MKYAMLLPALLLVPAFAWPHPVYGQAATPTEDQIETVTVTGERQSPLVTIHNFVATFSVTSPVAGVITRWREPICPATIGLTPQFNESVVTRMRKIAGLAGAMAKDAPCKPNIIVTFTPEPDALLAAAKEKNPFILGTGPARDYAMRHPIQAWYGTATVDLRGNVTVDGGDIGITGGVPKGFGMLPMAGIGGVPTTARAGSRIRDGMASIFSSVFIVVDSKKMGDAPLSAIADYVTMLALAQTEAFETCEPLPSISNLMAPGCSADKKSTAITPSDIAFLRAVYKTNIGASLMEQQANIASEMALVVPAD